MFTSKEFEDFAARIGFKLINVSPYCAQANGQADASNHIPIKIIKKKINENPRKWHSILSETLWYYRMACHGSTKCSPYELVYGHEAILPWEISLESRIISQQDKLIADDYKDLMLDNLDDLNFHQLKPLENVRVNIIWIAKFYNQKVRERRFSEGELVWKVILPIGSNDNKFGKWSPNWKGPYQITRVAPRNAYFYVTLNG